MLLIHVLVLSLSGLIDLARINFVDPLKELTAGLLKKTFVFFLFH